MFRHSAFPLAASAFVIAVSGQPAAAQDCTPIRFDPGTSGTVVAGVVPMDGQTCYSLSVRPGQRAHVGIVSGAQNVAVTVTDVGDNRRSFDFTTEKSYYELLVHQTLRAAGDDPFTLQVRVY